MTLYGIVKVLHILAMAALIAGMSGRAALAQQRVTVELRAALADQAIRLSHLYEYRMVAVVTSLMVTKPF
jgi:hypothetical protein